MSVAGDWIEGMRAEIDRLRAENAECLLANTAKEMKILKQQAENAKLRAENERLKIDLKRAKAKINLEVATRQALTEKE